MLVGKNLNNGLAAGIRIEGYRIKFTVEQTLRGPPNTAHIQLYNVGPTNENLIRKEFDDVVLEAGYNGNSRVIFHGNIKFATHYRGDGGVNWITEIQAADGDRAYTESHVGVTLTAGRTPHDAVDILLSVMPGVRKGYIELPSTGYARGKTLSGPSRKVLEQLARDFGASWSIQNGVLNIVRADSVLPGTAIQVNAKTGMLSAPEISAKGVKVKLQLNPMAEPNKVLQVNNNDLKTQVTQLYSSGPKTRATKIARLDPDGRYKIYKLRHEGDTRGADWSTEAESIGIGQPIPKGGT